MAKGFGISDLASLGFGQVGQLLDTMDMMSKTWSAMALPAGLDPGASIEDLDKRINDLRAIEQWLALNQNMLRNTIQALEVQRGTLAALQSFGQAMGADGRDGAMPWDPARLAALFAAAQRPTGAAPAGQGGAGTPATGAGEAGKAAATSAGSQAAPEPASDEGRDAGTVKANPASADPAQLAQAWWNMLNEQFQQLAAAAVGGMTPTGAASAAPAASADPATAEGGRKRGGRKASTPQGGRKGAPRSA